MTPREAYEKLERERKLITRVLRRDADKYPTADRLAHSTINHHSDPDNLKEIIELAAQYVKAG